MSLHERPEWNTSFPFSPSRLRSGQRFAPNIGGLSDPDCGRINAQDIPEGRAQDDPDQGPAALLPTLANIRSVEKLTLNPAARAGRPAAHQSGLRLLPMEAFVWGSRSLPPQPRTRPDHTLIWVTDGRMQVDFPRRHHVMRLGDLRLIPAGTAFAALPGTDARGHVALIPAHLARLASPRFPDKALAAHIGQHGPQLLATLHDLAAEARAPESDTIACLMNLLSLRLGQLDPQRRIRQTRIAQQPDRPLVERFLTLAAQSLGSCDLVAEMAQQLNTTTAALDRSCVAARGRRAIELVHELRLERAVDLLRNSDQRPDRIASELGYTSHAHFTRAFVAATGRVPEVFRAQSR